MLAKHSFTQLKIEKSSEWWSGERAGIKKKFLLTLNIKKSLEHTYRKKSVNGLRIYVKKFFGEGRLLLLPLESNR